MKTDRKILTAETQRRKEIFNIKNLNVSMRVRLEALTR
jgi:hypothetical protein